MSEAPKRIWICKSGGNWSPVDGGTQDIEYIRADLADLKVKPMVWHKSQITPWNEDYHTIGSGYSIRCADENEWKWSNGIGGFGYARTPSCAMAAAQADHELRILKALA